MNCLLLKLITIKLSSVVPIDLTEGTQIKVILPCNNKLRIFNWNRWSEVCKDTYRIHWNTTYYQTLLFDSRIKNVYFKIQYQTYSLTLKIKIQIIPLFL